ncbi:MAG: DNA mismatch repair endonuclease MutL [Chlamydiia bacterium]
MQRRSIHLLEEHLINLIAAGEVVENPSSCIKELVENSIDAQSSSIHIDIKGGGFEFIKIMDNGIGMLKEDALLCFERHATSKIQKKEDLKGIQTLGFRGEALSSIASISHVLMKTAPQELQEATKVEVKAGKLLDSAPCHREPGTTFEIYSLFHNVPARLEFQKTVKGATMEITKMVQKIALCNPKVRFSYTIDKKIELDCPAEQTLQERAETLFGTSWIKKMQLFEFQEDSVRCYGLISLSQEGQKTRAQQYFFINQRTASNPLIQMAAFEAYQRHFPPKTHPALILFLDIPFDLVDVNVHPQKSLVRLKEEKSWFRIVQKAIDRALIAQQSGSALAHIVHSWDGYEYPLEKRKGDFSIEEHSISPREHSISPFFFPDWSLVKNKTIEELETRDALGFKKGCAFGEKGVLLRQSFLIEVVGILIIDGFLIAKWEEKTALVDLDALEDFLAKEQMYRMDASIQTECVSRSLRLESTFDQDEERVLELLRNYGIEARFLSKMSLSIEGLAPCIDPEKLNEIVLEILQNPERTQEMMLEKILPKFRKGYLKKDILLATQAFKELLETKKDFSKKVFIFLERNHLSRCFSCKD